MRRVIVTTFYLLTAITPLIFTSINYELFEFPKFIVLFISALVLGSAWLIHAVSNRDWQLSVAKAPRPLRLLQWSIFAILLTQLVTTLISIHPYTSFWGYYSRFHQGLITTLCFTVIYFTGLKWLTKDNTLKIINISINTSILIGIIAVLEHYNLSLTCTLMTIFSKLQNAGNAVIFDTSCWGVSTNPLNRSFATLGQPNWLAAYLIPHLYLVMFLRTKNQLVGYKNIWPTFLSLGILFTALIFTGSRSGILAFVLSFAVYWLVSLRQFNFSKLRRDLYQFSIFFFLLALVLGTPFTPPISRLIQTNSAPDIAIEPTPTGGGTVLEQGGTESGDIRKIVWSGALRLIQHHPLFGTGPETFAYTYYWERPLLHNYTSEWDYLYNKAHNEYLNLAATSGLIGLAAYLFWHFAVFYSSLLRPEPSKKIDKSNELAQSAYQPVAAAGLVSFAVTNFFGFSVIPVYLLMILLSLFLTTLNRRVPPSNSVLSATAYWLFAAGTIILIIYFPIRFFLADYYFFLGKPSSDRPAGYIPLLERAVKLRPSEALYKSYLAEAYAQTADSGNNLEKALALAASSKESNPYHLNFYKSRAKVYITLAATDPAYYLPAAEELGRARELAPTDPKLAYNLGLVYSRLGRIEDAESQISQAINLKRDYQDAYYALTLLYEQTEQADKIPDLLRTAQSNLATYSGLLQEKFTQYLSL